MQLSSEKEEMLSVIKENDLALRNHFDYKHYFAPEIPEKVIKILIKHFDNHLPINSLVAFYDGTILGSAKGGLLFTNDGLFYRDIGKANYYNYSDIESMEVCKGTLKIKLKSDENIYTIISSFNVAVLKDILEQLKLIDAAHGQSLQKTSGKVKKLDLPSDMEVKCNAIIHSASVACGGVGTGLAQIPVADMAVITPIQIGMIIGLGAVFELNITESTAKSIIASAGVACAGRAVSQALVGWIPIAGNAINTATAAGLTEAIGWIAVKHFYDRWIEDKNKGRLEGMKDGYNEASGEYERKLRAQAQEFFYQKKNVERERDEYERLLDEYEAYIEKLELKCAEYEKISEFKHIYENLKNLK